MADNSSVYWSASRNLSGLCTRRTTASAESGSESGRSPILMPMDLMEGCILKSIARQKSAGAKTKPCLTPDTDLKGADIRFPRRTQAVVLLCSLLIKSSRVVGTPMPFKAFHSPTWSTESNAGLRLTYPMCRGFLNSQRISDKWRAKMVSNVDLFPIKPDCLGRCF